MKIDVDGFNADENKSDSCQHKTEFDESKIDRVYRSAIADMYFVSVKIADSCSEGIHVNERLISDYKKIKNIVNRFEKCSLNYIMNELCVRTSVDKIKDERELILKDFYNAVTDYTLYQNEI